MKSGAISVRVESDAFSVELRACVRSPFSLVPEAGDLGNRELTDETFDAAAVAVAAQLGSKAVAALREFELAVVEVEARKPQAPLFPVMS